MLARVKTSALAGIDALPIEVEVEAQSGSNGFNIIGLADNAVKESRGRITAALHNSGFETPEQILVNLAPAELKKEGSAFDLPIAVGILAASGQLPSRHLSDASFHGELSLDGRIKNINGSIAYAALNAKLHIPHIVLPRLNAVEARLIPSIRTVAVASLHETAAFLLDKSFDESIPPDEPVTIPRRSEAAFADVRGQDGAKRALFIAAAGGHNVLMIGPPGCGKSMLASRFPSLLPPLREQEMLEVIRIHSVAGMDIQQFLPGTRPFRAPHYHVSPQALVGGGSFPRPGEISLAHHGVLFLDEFPEFQRPALEALRLPLESGIIEVTRAKAALRFPARFQLIAAMNPCPCGRLGMEGAHCFCSPLMLQNYVKRLSQPILDRIDLHVELHRVSFNEMAKTGSDSGGETSSETINELHEMQIKRSGTLNAWLSSRSVLSEFQRGSGSSRAFLEKAHRKLGLSARGIIKVLKVARTIADLEGASVVIEPHIAEAISYRSLERMEKLFR